MVGAGIYSPERQTCALGSNRLKGWRRCNLGGGGEPTFEGGADMWAQGVGRPVGGASWAHLAASAPLLWHGVLLNLLEPSGVSFALDKHD